MNVRVSVGFDKAIIVCVLTALRSRRRRFTYTYHNQVRSGTRGIYAFWVRRRCLYVGISGDIQRRMYQHRMNEHNPKLERYLEAFPQEIEVSYIALSDIPDTKLRRLEQKMIRILRTATNIVHRRT